MNDVTPPSTASARAIIDALLDGRIDREQALADLEARGVEPRVENLDWARIDHDRAARRGFPEVIYGPGKTTDQVREIFVRLARRNPNVLCTRTTAAAHEAVREALEPEARAALRFDAQAGLLSLHGDQRVRQRGTLVVLSAGTADQKVANEALRCAEVLGNRVERLADVGVAGLHRLLAELPTLERASVIICVAGFEAALPSVVAGLVHCPVIAVPTSTGYGASFQGVTALLSCLTSCAAGVLTVNIDNGFGAAYAATLVNRLSGPADPADPEAKV
ncbi:nickel pincer cofactor biosynthesis protein LarB [Enhygromyxa salina]|uniref:N5-carboxyaminoimidazole ribonucleotide mutase n=1 Tax=Enhygromyxa salina TaxID=215803 RepID=A0A2S9YFL3_9BACT|nr:nickel pincer cofactor biosynthesis protein LarB [Enhygromyxa salina]PRQ03806.1 N5-carboxyaminoimidazole ribonucleotide mutase [Enhygromyxa salina]